MCTFERIYKQKDEIMWTAISIHKQTEYIICGHLWANISKRTRLCGHLSAHISMYMCGVETVVKGGLSVSQNFANTVQQNMTDLGNGSCQCSASHSFQHQPAAYSLSDCLNCAEGRMTCWECWRAGDLQKKLLYTRLAIVPWQTPWRSGFLYTRLYIVS